LGPSGQSLLGVEVRGRKKLRSPHIFFMHGTIVAKEGDHTL